MPPAVGHLIPFLLPFRTPHVMGLKLLKLLLHLGAPNYAFQSWYQDTYDQVIQDPDKELLAPIMFTMDKTVISEASHLSVYVILFNTSIYNRDPDKREVVLRINNEQVFCQTGRRGPNVTNDLIIRVISAENSQMNVVDKEGNQVVAARVPPKRFGKHDINWYFVGLPKPDFEDRLATSKQGKLEENNTDSEDN